MVLWSTVICKLVLSVFGKLPVAFKFLSTNGGSVKKLLPGFKFNKVSEFSTLVLTSIFLVSFPVLSFRLRLVNFRLVGRSCSFSCLSLHGPPVLTSTFECLSFLTFYLPTYTPVCLSTYLSAFLSIQLPRYPPIYLPTCLLVCLPVYVLHSFVFLLLYSVICVAIMLSAKYIIHFFRLSNLIQLINEKNLFEVLRLF